LGTAALGCPPGAARQLLGPRQFFLKKGAGADHLYTWNVRHFDLLGPKIKKLVTMPPMI
jgi:hypothetical protein